MTDKKSALISCFARLVAICMAVLACGSLAPPASAQESASANDESAQIKWIGVQNIVGVPSGRTIRAPFLSANSDAVFVSANTFPVRPTTTIGPRPALLLRIPGGPLPLPPAQMLIGFPKGVVDQHGTYHLFWGESDEPPAERRYRIPTINSLWYASWHHGAWSVPELLLKGSVLRWTPDQGMPVLDDSGRPHVILTGSLDGLKNATIYIRREAGRWKVRDLKPPATYATIVPIHGDSLIAAFIAADAQANGGTNTIFTELSTDGGLSWSSPRLVERFGTRLSTSPVLSLSGRTIHLMWAQSLSGGQKPEIIRHRVSNNSGATWTATDDARLLRDQELSLSVASSRCGVTLAMVESITSDNGVNRILVDEMRWSGTRVTTRRPFSEGWLMANPRVIASQDRFILIASLIARRGEPIHLIRAVSNACP